MAETLTGLIDRVTFHNVDNGYCVLRVTARGHRDPVTVVGTLPQVVAGEFIEASGDWINDRNFGPQFKSENLKTTPPHTAEGIVKYLGSGLVKGIGAKYARKIVDQFGAKTLEVIDQSVSHLSQVKGIGPKRLALIRDGWAESKAVRAIMVFLQSYGIGTARAVRIYKTYGDTAVDQVRNNPYRLSSDIWGIGFKIADDLALRIGIAKDSPVRARAAVQYVLKDASGHGHVCLPEVVLVEQTIALTDIAAEGIQAAIEQLAIENEIVRERPLPASKSRSSREMDQAIDPEFRMANAPLVYLKPLYAAEVGVAAGITALLNGRHPMPEIQVEKAVAWAEGKMGIELAKRQREAVAAACREKMLVITGGPGTGKTTLIKAILDIFAAKMRILFGPRLTPTCRAPGQIEQAVKRSSISAARNSTQPPVDSASAAIAASTRIVHDRRDLDGRSSPDARSDSGGASARACLVLVTVDRLPEVEAGKCAGRSVRPAWTLSVRLRPACIARRRKIVDRPRPRDQQQAGTGIGTSQRRRLLHCGDG
ncbi:MAG: helix-hairpin-helix domain-containing protein [Gemmataceae bacterium]